VENFLYVNDYKHGDGANLWSFNMDGICINGSYKKK
jgi:hypothetical protein